MSDARRGLRSSRGMLSGEMSWAFISFCVSIAASGAPIFRGTMHLLFGGKGPQAWAIAMCAASMCLFVAAFREWLAHRYACWRKKIGWTTEDTNESANVRAWCCGVLLPTWWYLAKIVVDHLGGLPVVSMLSFGASAFLAWSFVENRRVRREIRNGALEINGATDS